MRIHPFTPGSAASMVSEHSSEAAMGGRSFGKDPWLRILAEVSLLPWLGQSRGVLFCCQSDSGFGLPPVASVTWS